MLDARLGARVFLKAETLQRTGSFKFRGAYNKISSIPQDKRAAGVVAYSSGNHAQGVAHAAQLCGMPAVIVMPSDAPQGQARAHRGARRRGRALRSRHARTARRSPATSRRSAAPCWCRRSTIRWSSPGQGTAGREICEDLDELGLKPDVVVVGASGGGLIAGIALGDQGARCRRLIFYTAEPEGFDDTAALVQERQARAQPAHERHDLRRADDADAGRASPSRSIASWSGKGVSASDDEVGRAVAFAFRELKLVVEPGGAIGLAALLAGKLDVKGKVVVAVLSGGNVDAELFAKLVAA